MKSFTLDTNCLIALEEGRSEADALRALVKAHAEGRASVAAVAISASEKQIDGQHLASFEAFKNRLRKLSIDRLEIVPPMGYYGITYWNYCVYGSEAMVAFEQNIHIILFPNLPFSWTNSCNAVEEENDSEWTGSLAKWRNAKCDVQAMWSHIHAARDVFVTSDNNFHKATRKAALIDLGAGRIERPDAALQLIP